MLSRAALLAGKLEFSIHKLQMQQKCWINQGIRDYVDVTGAEEKVYVIILQMSGSFCTNYF